MAHIKKQSCVERHVNSVIETISINFCIPCSGVDYINKLIVMNDKKITGIFSSSVHFNRSLLMVKL